MSSTVDIIPANAHLIGLWLQLIATGAYWVYFPKCVAVLRRKIKDGLSIWMPLVCGLFFLLTTTSVITEMIRAYTAFSAHPPALPNPVVFYADASTPGSLIKNTINVVQAIISDGVIVYRTFIVWNCSYLIIILPLLVFLAQSGMGIWSIYTLSQTKSGSLLILADVSIRVRYFFILTFCLNMLCACLICFKIYRTGFKWSKGHGSDSPLRHVVGVIIESAGLYCAYLLILIVSDSVGSNVFFIFLDPSPPIVAIVYSMLIVRARAPREQTTSTPLPSTVRFGTLTARSSMRQQASFPGVEISLERVVHTDNPSSPRSPRSFNHPYAIDHPYALEQKGEAY